MRSIASAALIVMLATPAWAQDSLPAADNSNGDVAIIRVHEDVLVTDKFDSENVSDKVADKKFWAVSAAMNSAMLLDTWSTFDVIRRCADCREANPYVAPFVKRGPAVTFVAGQAFDIGVIALSAKMKASKNPRVRRLWWLVPVALTAGHVIAYQHNMRLER